MKIKFSVMPLSIALLTASTLCVAAEGVQVSTASTQRKLPIKAALSAVSSQYASRMNTSGLMEGAKYDNFIVYYRTYTGLRNTTDSTAATNNARVSSARNIAIQEKRVITTGGRVIQTAKGMSAADAQAFMLEYAKSAEVEFIEPDAIMQPNGWFQDWEALVPYLEMRPVQPNDSGYSQQWAMRQPDGLTGGLIGLPKSWNIATGRGVVVAVVDTGITAHSDLAGQVLPGYNFVSNATFDRNRTGRSPDASDPGDWLQMGDQCPANGGPYYVQDSSWHGTHVAGIVAAKTSNGIGVAGTAFNSKILPVRALARCGGTTSDIADGIVWASGGSVSGVPANPNPAKVINLSLGGRTASCSYTFQQAIDTARSNGATVVVSAGNNREDAANQQPANCQGVIVVGASNSAGNIADWFSNFGSLVSVMAPGEDIYSTVNLGKKDPTVEGYGWMTGTSQAAPHVSGIVAMLLEQHPGLTADQVKKYIVPTATPMGLRGASPCPQGCGSGIIYAYNVLTMPLSGRAVTIQPGESVPNLSGSRWDTNETWYAVTLPVGTSSFTFTTTGGTGQAVLLKVTDDVTNQRSGLACFDDGDTPGAVCQHSFPPLTKPVTYYITLGARTSYSNVTLVTQVQ